MEVIKVNGIPREGVGKAATKVVRHSEAIPCVLYGGNDNVHFTTTWSEVRHLIYTPDFKTCEVTIDGNMHKAILKDVQFHPASEKIMHIDFLMLTPGQAIKVNVPLRLKGQSPGVKAGGKLVQNYRKVRMSGMPEQLPEDIKIDITALNIGDLVRVRELKVEGCTILEPEASAVVQITATRASASEAAADAKATPAKK